MPMSLTQSIACACAVWSSFIFAVQAIGIIQLFRYYSKPPRRATLETQAVYTDDPSASSAPPSQTSAVPYVTVIRPVKGLEAGLYECLASTFRQTYPRDRLSLCLCVESRADPSFPVLEQVLADFALCGVSARIYVEDEDPLLHGAAGSTDTLGPNPKIRNISRAYRDAPADGLVWIIDCNVWVAPGVAGRMVQKLVGSATETPYKFVHQLPLVVDISAPSSSLIPGDGAALDEMFMATTHAKFYSAINTVGIAPCIVGKSNMFRKAHLDRLTDPVQNPTVLTVRDANRGRGVDFFSSYICEDHLIGDLLWRSPLPGFRNHGLVTGDLAIQPMNDDVSVHSYAARRVRWLRVRKWTVLLATLVEPGVESLLCAAYASFAWANLAAPSPTVLAFVKCWLAIVGVWMTADWFTYRRLHSCDSVAQDDNTPLFAQQKQAYRKLGPWIRAWLGREMLALPIWTYAVLLGATVDWRGRPFRVRMDMSVERVGGDDPAEAQLLTGSRSGSTDGTRASTPSKARVD
ncbi:ceramide glucosyltransferase [Ophiostoma piceae UAMH 11346]|uniref:Ceramide glucosyltransferase n=1 Tax=Ophiostoma piceae (strain UAMH 11346) TaxID=1262450 RepID=S3C6H6_OPHP1|nr:ceramide glucosyltransferase [Ophiostoma piceae UAMH 11346]